MSRSGAAGRVARGLHDDAGERLLEDVGDPTLEPVKVVASPVVTHVEYRVIRTG